MIKRLANLALLCIGFNLFADAQTTRTVCSNGCDYTTLQAAINAAASGDIILLNVSGTFTEKNIALPEKNLTIRGLGKTTTILQSTATRGDATNGGRLFSYAVPVTGGTRITFEDMTMQNAMAGIVGSNSQGGAFYAIGSLKGLVVTFNRIRFYANETIVSSTVSNYSTGACIYLSGTGSTSPYNADLTVTDCDFDNNRIPNPFTATQLANGTCISLSGSTNRYTITNSTFTNNSAYTRGGAIIIEAESVATIRNCRFEGNSARKGEGGAINSRSMSNIKIENCVFSNNAAAPEGVAAIGALYGSGGAIACKGALIRNCTFVGNSAERGGALVRSLYGSVDDLHIINCTFSGNTASVAGKTIQFGNAASTSTYPLRMVNNIIANGGGAAPTEIHLMTPFGSLQTNSSNYCNSISSNSGGTAPSFDFTSTSHPTLGLSTTLANNGGPLQSLSLQANSQMINAGTTAMGVAYDISAKDGRSYSRTDGGIDVGAFEYGGIADNAAMPDITNVTLGTAQPNGDRAVTADIADVNGVYWFPQLTDLRPRLYFRKNNGTWFSVAGNLTGGNGRSGSWSFDLSAATLGGLAAGDRLEYYVITQDVSGTPAIASAPAGATATDVLSIIVPPPTTVKVLPVKLEAFAVRKAGKDAIISWTVGDEQALSHYEVERSTDAGQWTVIGRRTATAARTYEWKDGGLTAALYFYRLRSVDKNGDYSLSAIRKLEVGSSNTLLVYPNPVTGTTTTLILEKGSTVSLYNSAGILLWTKEFTAGAHTISVQELPAGTYRLVNGSTSASLLVP